MVTPVRAAARRPGATAAVGCGDRRRSAGLAVVLAAAVAPAVFLAVDPAGWYPYGPVKWLAASTLVLAAAALASRDRAGRSDRWLTRASILLVAGMVVGAVVGADPVLAWTGTPERNAGVAFWVVCALALWLGQRVASSVPDAAGTQAVPGPIRTGLLVATVGMAVAGVAEALGWEPEVLDVGTRLTGTMGSSAYLGAVAALLVPISAGLGRAAWRPRNGGSTLTAVVGWTATAGLLVTLVGSGARAAWVGLAAAASLLVVARRRWLGEHRGLALGLAAVAITGVVAVLTLSPAGDRLGSLSDAESPGGRGRLDEWRVATRVLAEHPVTGVGPEGYRVAFAEGVDLAYQSRHGRDPLPDRAHSAPLDVALAGGPLALAGWAGIVVIVGRSAWRALRSGGPVEVGLAAGLVAHGVGQLFLFPLAEVTPVVWLLAGVLVATQARGVDAASAPPAARGTSQFATAALTVAAVGALAAGVLAVAADRNAGRAATTGSVASAESAVALRPDFPRHHLLLARLRLLDGDGTLSAIEAVRDGRRWSPDDPVLRRTEAELLVARAIATEVPAHAEEARSYLWRVIADDPLDAELWAVAVTLAAIDG